MDMFTAAGLTALLQVIAIDLVLAGDNAVVIGLAAAGLEATQRRKAIIVGILAATVLRILFASVAVYLLAIVGLLLAGGLLLLWVCWKMWRELRAGHGENHEATGAEGAPKRPSFRRRPRSSSPTSRCRSTTYSPLPVQRANIRAYWSSVLPCRSR